MPWRKSLIHRNKIHQITIRTMNNKLGEGISEAERTKIEETEDIQINQGYQNRSYQNQGSNNYQNNQDRGRYGNNLNRVGYRGRNNFRGNNGGNFSNNYNNNFTNNNFQQQGYQSNETTLNTGNSGGHIETTAFSQKVCYGCGYPNHTSRNCEARGKSSTRGGQIPFNSQPKN